MRRTAAVLAVAVLVAAAFAIAGCDMFHDYKKDANAIIAKANKSLATYQSLESSAQAAAAQLDAIALDPKAANRALSITASVKATLASEKAVLTSATVELGKIKALKVKPEMKTYAAMEIKAIEAQMLVVDASVRLFNELDKVYTATAKKTGTTKQVEQTMASIDAITTEIQTLTEAAAKAQANATAYFNKKVATK